jgi:hypothetical protein
LDEFGHDVVGPEVRWVVLTHPRPLRSPRTPAGERDRIMGDTRRDGDSPLEQSVRESGEHDTARRDHHDDDHELVPRPARLTYESPEPEEQRTPYSAEERSSELETKWQPPARDPGSQADAEGHQHITQPAQAVGRLHEEAGSKTGRDRQEEKQVRMRSGDHDLVQRGDLDDCGHQGNERLHHAGASTLALSALKAPAAGAEDSD